MSSALQRLVETSTHDQVRSQARGALWILEGKEQKTATISDMPSTSTGSVSTSSTAHSVCIAAGLDKCLRDSPSLQCYWTGRERERERERV